MTGVLQGFAVIAVVVAVGVGLGRWQLLGPGAEQPLARLVYYVATPCLLVRLLEHRRLADVFGPGFVVASVSAVVVIGCYLPVARGRWRQDRPELVVGALSASYANAGYLGLPIGAFVLGNAAYAVPVMVFQLLVYAPLAITLLGLDGGARRPGPSAVLAAGLRNPVSVGALSGVALSLWGGQLPAVLEQPLSLFGGMAVPGALLAFGISLSHIGRTGGPAREQIAVIAVLKLMLQPLVAFALARAWGLSPDQVRAVTVMAALPTAQNVFVYATRFGRGEAIARDAVAVTTLAAAPVILVIATVLVPG